MKKKFLKAAAVLISAAVVTAFSGHIGTSASDLDIMVGENVKIEFDTGDGSFVDKVESLSPKILSVDDTDGIMLGGLSEGIAKLKVASGSASRTFDITVRYDTSKEFLLGDINDDGRADTADIRVMQEYFAKKDPVIMNFSAGDVNRDGRTDIFDILCFKRMVAENRLPQKPAVTTAATTTGIAATTTTTTITTVATTQKPVTTAAPVSEDDYAEQMLKLMNEERARVGAAPLKVDKTLCAAANKRAQEIRQSFSHTRPDGTRCFTVLGEYGLNYSYVGENIACGNSTVKATYDQWKNSQGHYENMTSTDFTEYGLGYFCDPSDPNGYRYYWVQLFRKPR